MKSVRDKDKDSEGAEAMRVQRDMPEEASCRKRKWYRLARIDGGHN